MKKILLLGGSAQQVIAIKTAQRLGYYTVLCDFLTDNPGQYEADVFYLVSTTDKDAVLEVAQKEKIDGVLRLPRLILLKNLACRGILISPLRSYAIRTGSAYFC